jgi:hypothetical protein
MESKPPASVAALKKSVADLEELYATEPVRSQRHTRPYEALGTVLRQVVAALESPDHPLERFCAVTDTHNIPLLAAKFARANAKAHRVARTMCLTVNVETFVRDLNAALLLVLDEF